MVKIDHMMTAQMEANLMQQEWNNRGPNLWTQDEQIIAVTPGQPTYAIPGETIMVTNVTLGWGVPPNEQQLTITPVSRQIYSMYPNKDQIGRPTSYWYDRQIAPTITLWPVPDQAYTLHVWRYRAIMDAKLANAGAFEFPARWFDAATAGMSHRLARHFATDLEAIRKGDSDEAYKIASTQDVEDNPLYFVPMLEGYFR